MRVLFLVAVALILFIVLQVVVFEQELETQSALDDPDGGCDKHVDLT